MREQRFGQRMNQQSRNRKKAPKHRVNNEDRSLGLIGKRFGDLVVLRRSRSGRVGAWIAKCDCGKLALVYDYLLKSGDTKNCGCNPATQELTV
ncbi:MAG: hypothetical protein MUC98_06750 [Desulfobacterota bacterium]|nr:hypothetical protein [Thermodesulfobacteriota bacterium]